MSYQPEPLAAILAEMRGRILGEDRIKYTLPADEALAFVDRIEAAAERERQDAMKTAFLTRCKVCEKVGPASSPGNAAAMRHALERILDIEGYGAPWIEAKVIAQKALEGEQCTPPVAQERPKIEQPGNAAAMHEALERIRPLVRATGATPYVPERKELVDGALAIIDGALAAPARNCDVGTAEEQAERHERFCAAHYKADAVDAQCFGCSASDKKETSCEFVWGQLPFAPAKEGAAK